MSVKKATFHESDSYNLFIYLQNQEMFNVLLSMGLQNLKTIYKRLLYFENWTVSGSVLKMFKWSAFITKCDWTFPHAVQRDYSEMLIFQNRNKENELQSQFLKNSTLNMLLCSAGLSLYISSCSQNIH